MITKIKDGVMGAAIDIWMAYGHMKAEAEGWNLFRLIRLEESAVCRLEIEMCNNPEDWPAGWATSPFHSDADVLRKLAQEKKRHHLLALYLEGRPPGTNVYVPTEMIEPEHRNCCERCAALLDPRGHCTDKSCPFSDHLQDCAVGWVGTNQLADDQMPICSC
jgi:hypothetical protein